jgi:hypothetical protein
MKPPHLTTYIYCEKDPVIFAITTKGATLEEALKHARKVIPFMDKPYLIKIADLKGPKEIYRKEI